MYLLDSPPENDVKDYKDFYQTAIFSSICYGEFENVKPFRYVLSIEIQHANAMTHSLYGL